jgi:hypothetical protein
MLELTATADAHVMLTPLRQLEVKPSGLQAHCTAGTSEGKCSVPVQNSQQCCVVQLGMDLMLHMVMEAWIEQRQSDLSKVLAIFEQAAPSEGIASPEDFKAMMRCINLALASMLPERIVAEMYREGLQASKDGHRIDAEAFFEVPSPAYIVTI